MDEITGHELTGFLNQLARCYRHGGRLYLVGGSSLLLAASKTSTLDVDIKIETTPEHYGEFIRCLRQVSRQLQIPVEEASPDQFIPLPPGYAERHRFIGRYGSLDVFHFDFYSMALSKIHRGNEKDFADVTAMISQNLIELARLRSHFEIILPQVASFSLRSSPEDFAAKFDLLEKRLSVRPR
ncbi:MAG: hypothetical protein KJZ86_14640 [Caldilineaceae bacterium]|nr:hypothetical protein [Caldilineaceae bacterium]HRJ45009.1 hypothetical protein [Caldilineaceae bacterium]